MPDLENQEWWIRAHSFLKIISTHPNFCCFGMLGSKLLPEVILAIDPRQMFDYNYKWRPYKVRWLHLWRKGQKWLSQYQSRPFYSRHSHAVCTLQVHHPPPPVPSLLLMWPKDIVISDIMKLNSDIAAIGPKSDHVVRFPRPSPSVFAYCKQAKPGDVEGQG